MSGTEPTTTNASDPMLPRVWRVTERWQETYDTFSLALRPQDGFPETAFAPGQFNMLYAFGTGESAISISSDPAAPEGLIHTIRRVGTVTAALDRLRPGDQLGLRGPFGVPWPMEELRGRDLVFVAGGIGLAPLRPAIYHALNHRGEYGRIIVLAGARTPEDVLFAAELEAWRARKDVACEITVDRGGDGWNGNVGVVTKLIARVAFDPTRAVALVCGPEIMMRYTVMELRRLGVSETNIYITMERNMKCAVAFCGHCQLGPEFICKNGPVYRFDRIAFWFGQREA